MANHELSRFLTTLWPVLPEGHWLLFWGTPSKRSEWVQAITDETLASLERAAQRENIYIGCATRGSNLGPTLRGTEEQCTAIPGVWVDIDYGTEHKKPNLPPTYDDALTLLESLGLPASMVVHTGRGLHAWWVFREPLLLGTEEERAYAKRLTMGWCDTLRAHARTRGWDADQVGDLTRVMRLPGLWNRKGAPLRTKLLNAEEFRYNPSEIEAHLIATRDPVIPVPDIAWRFELAPHAEPPADKFMALCELDIKFRLSWLHKRTDLQDQSASSYDLSLATRALTAGWSAQEVVNLLIAGRRKHGADLKLRQDYYEHTLSKALSGQEQETRQQTIEDLKAGKPVPPLVAHDPAENLAILSDLLEIPITKFVRYRGQKNSYQLEVEGRTMNVETIDHLESQTRFRRLILDHSNKLIPLFKGEAWRDRIVQLFQAVQDVDVSLATNRGTYENWIELHLNEFGIERENWHKAAYEYRPFAIDGGTHIVSEGFRRFIVSQMNERITTQGMTVELAKLGYQFERKTVKTPKGKTTTKRSVWLLH